jgi:hypothetical protein
LSVDCQIAFEPVRRIEIEVIRRLIEQKNICRAYELSRNAKASPLSATQLRETECALRLDRIRDRAELRRHAVQMYSRLLSRIARDPGRIWRALPESIFHRARRSSRLFGQRLLELEQIGKLACSSGPTRCQLHQSLDAAREVRSRGSGCFDTAPEVGSCSPVISLKERCLAGPVAADDSPPLASRNRECHIAKERCSTKLYERA